ncbi:unnamed protein product [Angiostrongylus costaricensis]|uniref:Hormone-sensitive lipase n=1 Tax=Angiostrongylus costaricensis TaxID=334426 RepID=A0A158PI99_ANGCS|nr:unnamed protein product [Angiostrongylus costaricensis]
MLVKISQTLDFDEAECPYIDVDGTLRFLHPQLSPLFRRWRGMPDNRALNDDNRAVFGPRLSIERTAIFTLLNQLCSDNAEYFSKVTSWSGYSERMVNVSSKIQYCSGTLRDIVSRLQNIAPNYDYDEHTPGNGFRSLVCICDTTVLHLVSLQKTVTEQRGSFVFRLAHYCKELEAFAKVVDFLNVSLPLCIENYMSMPSGSLFPPLQGSYDKYYEILRDFEKLDSTCFYGRPLGFQCMFQFSPSVNRIFRVIGIVLASYSLSWEKGHGPIGSIINTGRFFLSPEQRASRIIKASTSILFNHFLSLRKNLILREMMLRMILQIESPTCVELEDFFKALWQHSSLRFAVPLFQNMPKWFSPNMAINELREINWVGPITLESTRGGKVRIPEPSAHTGPRPVQIRVLSSVHRPHMSPASSSNQQPPSPYIVFHCHGGGYVATSSKSHETYLRVWAKLLNCTVVSVEYSLAPANPFPRPTEEVIFAYAWINNNPHLVGGYFKVAAYTGAYPNGKKLAESTEHSAHKSLQEYVDQVQKSQPFDFAGGSQSIVSLVQNVNDPNQVKPFEAGSFFPEKEKAQEMEQEDGQSSDDDDDTGSISSVHIGSDPLHIQLSSTIFDSDLLNYLVKHPTTKNSLVMVDENGGVIRDQGILAMNPDVSKEKDKKRLGLLSSAGGMISDTVPSTPCEDRQGISSSISSNNFQNQPSQIHKRSLSQSLADTAVLAAGHAFDNLQDWLEKPTKEKQKLDRTVSHSDDVDSEKPCTRRSFVLDLLDNSTVPRDPLISPMYAADEVIRQLPPVYFIACHLDPLLDDTIAFASRLQAAGGRVGSVDILPAIPHGFLNFTLVSPECRRGAKICLERIKQALGYVESATV